jgi:hypothetical protein
MGQHDATRCNAAASVAFILNRRPRGEFMANRDSDSMADLIRTVLIDTRDLIREELALARAEIREELATAMAAGASFGAAAAAALLGVVLLAIAVGGLIAYLLRWPAWAGYGVVAIILLAIAYGLWVAARRRFARIRTLPRTTETIKENMQWMQNKSGQS